ncbi:hypothetical protein HDZ31DRAFT_67177 [Schizophyllum fasciatum]
MSAPATSTATASDRATDTKASRDAASGEKAPPAKGHSRQAIDKKASHAGAGRKDGSELLYTVCNPCGIRKSFQSRNVDIVMQKLHAARRLHERDCPHKHQSMTAFSRTADEPSASAKRPSAGAGKAGAAVDKAAATRGKGGAAAPKTSTTSTKAKGSRPVAATATSSKQTNVSTKADRSRGSLTPSPSFNAVLEQTARKRGRDEDEANYIKTAFPLNGQSRKREIAPNTQGDQRAFDFVLALCGTGPKNEGRETKEPRKE